MPAILGPRTLGLAGLLPALACLAAVLVGGEEWRYVGLAAGFGYAAMIFSFLGGLWWGLAAAPGAAGQTKPRGWIYGLAVLPSLIAFALYLPWIFGLPWPGPSLVVLGIAIALSPLVDRRLRADGLAPDWWLPLRWSLSLGLGVATLAMGLAAPA